ncbi:MAG: hypothetical protein KGY39_04475 [Anaerolineales bacterium]|nr:hypothetical protein [Anaerolineales bacterium]MBS3752388.1 hypothetical protein [Anaerolineales bacterium]
MKKKILLIVSISTALALALTACGSQTETTDLTEPDDVYWAYYDACSSQDPSQAEGHLTESAKQKTQNIGVCGFTHDSINTYEQKQGNPARSFPEDPTLTVNEEVASLTWVDDRGNLAIVILVAENGKWKIEESRWSK